MPNKPFIKKDNVTDFFNGEINNEIKRRNFDFFHEIFNPNNITECERRILYRARGEKNKQSHNIFFEIDTQEAVKNKWLNFFKKSLSIKLLDRDVVVADCNFNLTGKVDGILKANNSIFVLIVRALNSKDFIRITEKGALRKHIVELMVYMWLAEIKDGIILYENKDNQEFCLYHVVPYLPILEASRKKCMQLLEHKIKGTMPTQPYKNQDEPECTICEFKDKCWGNDQFNEPISKIGK